jgi:hypothetical protein
MIANRLKAATKLAFWLLITTWAVMVLFFECFKLIHEGLTNIYLNFCCSEDFDLRDIFKAFFWLCVFNVILSLFMSIQTDVQ